MLNESEIRSLATASSRSELKNRAQKIKESILDEFKGIGESRKRELLKHFGTIRNLKNATINELIQQKGIGEKTAERLQQFLEQN